MIPALWSAGFADATATEIGLGALAGYRGYFDEVDGLVLQEHAFEQNLRAELDTALVSRALAAWHVGFALDHTLTLGPQDRSRVLGLTYDTELQLWRDGALPVRLFASRQTTGAEQSAYPGYAVLSDTYGYEAAIRPPGLPRLSSLGLFQQRRTDAGGDVRDERTTLVNGQLLHNDNRLLALAGIERRRDEDPVGDERRDVDEAEAFVDYRLDKNTAVVGRARARRYASTVGGTTYLLDTVTSDAAVATRPHPDVKGTTWYRVSDLTGAGTETGDAALGTSWTWYATKHLSTTAQVGIGDTWTADATGRSSFIGEFANLSADHTTWSKRGGTQLFAQTGAASVLDAEGAGVQAGGAGGGVLRRTIGALQLAGGVDGGAQVDTSPREQTYVTYGWLAEVASRPLDAVQLQLQATQAVVDQRQLDVGDSDRLRIAGQATYRPEFQLDLVYGLNVYRDALDDEVSTGMGHAVSARAVLAPGVQALALYRYSSAGSSTLASQWSHRVEGTVLFHAPIADLSARVSHTRVGGEVAPAASTFVWFEVSREFRWEL